MDSKIQPQHKDGSTLSQRGRLRPLVRRRKYNKTTIMNTKHIPDLELCQELDRLCKEKGIVVPETEFYWVETSTHEIVVSDQKEAPYMSIPAPLVSEQGEWLPEIVDDDGMDARFVSYKNNSIWTVMYGLYGMEIEIHSVSADTEANARQKMINYLLAEGIITKL